MTNLNVSRIVSRVQVIDLAKHLPKKSPIKIKMCVLLDRLNKYYKELEYLTKMNQFQMACEYIGKIRYTEEKICNLYQTEHTITIDI